MTFRSTVTRKVVYEEEEYDPPAEILDRMMGVGEGDYGGYGRTAGDVGMKNTVLDSERLQM